MTGTVQLHRVLTSTPEKIWRAFTQADAFARWLPPNGFVGRIEKLEAEVGGAWRGSFTNFTTGSVIYFGGKYLDLVENECIAYTAHQSRECGRRNPHHAKRHSRCDPARRLLSRLARVAAKLGAIGGAEYSRLDY